MNRVRIHFNGRDIDVVSEKIQGRLWFHYEGQTYDYEPESGGNTNKSTRGLATNEIVAPMPGKILRVEVKAGDPVKIGQVLIVMEAMKMEYTLAAASDGKADLIACKVGDQVKLGQLLVKLG